MGISECSPAGRQSVDVRSFHHGMASKITDPVVLIVNGDEQNIRLSVRGKGWNGKKREEAENEKTMHDQEVASYP